MVLVRGDFAWAPKPEPPASDRIDKATWSSIVALPDDVAVRTSNHHGTALRQLDDLWGAWIESFGENNGPMFSAMLDAADDFQSATYTALTGFYRLSVSALRSALELTTIGTWAQVCGKPAEYKKWRHGKLTISFAQACDGLIAPTSALREELGTTVKDSLFDQKSAAGDGGYARRIYSGISNYSHARPGHSDGDIRKSNGPIYVKSAFDHVSWIHFEVIGLCFVLLLIARPESTIPLAALDLFADVKRLKSRVTRAAFSMLHHG